MEEWGGDVEAKARSKVLSSRNKIVFLGFCPSSQSENRHNKKDAHLCSEGGSSLPSSASFGRDQCP